MDVRRRHKFQEKEEPTLNEIEDESIVPILSKLNNESDESDYLAFDKSTFQNRAELERNDRCLCIEDDFKYNAVNCQEDVIPYSIEKSDKDDDAGYDNINDPNTKYFLAHNTLRPSTSDGEDYSESSQKENYFLDRGLIRIALIQKSILWLSKFVSFLRQAIFPFLLNPYSYLRGGVVLICVIILTILAFFMAMITYSFAYHLYIPKQKVTLPVFFDQKTEIHSNKKSQGRLRQSMAFKGVLKAQISLKRGLLRESIPYDILLEFSVPDQNRLAESIGNFMATVALMQPTDVVFRKKKDTNDCHRPILGQCNRNDEFKLIWRQSRYLHLRYKSSIVRYIQTFILAPLYVTGYKEEAIKQKFLLANQVAFSDSISDSQSIPASNSSSDMRVLKVKLESIAPLPIYSQVNIHFVAHFRGLRYFMYYWFFSVLIASILVLTIMYFLLLMLGLTIIILLVYLISKTSHFNDTF